MWIPPIVCLSLFLWSIKVLSEAACANVLLDEEERQMLAGRPAVAMRRITVFGFP